MSCLLPMDEKDSCSTVKKQRHHSPISANLTHYIDKVLLSGMAHSTSKHPVKCVLATDDTDKPLNSICIFPLTHALSPQPTWLM